MEIERQFNEGGSGPPVSLVPADGSITAVKLATFNTPADDQVLAWDANNNRLYWKVDENTTYTELPPTDASVTEAKLAAHNSPTAGQVLAWDTTNGLYWKDDADSGFAIGGTQAAGKYIRATSASAQEWADFPSIPTIPAALPPTDASVTEAKLDAHNSPTSGQVLAWDSTDGLYWKDDADSGFTIGGTQATGKYIRATSASAQEWADFPSIPTIPAALPPTDASVTEAKLDAHNSPTSGQVLAWDSTDGLYWKDDASGGESLTIGGTQAVGKYIRATSGTAQEWTDFPTIPTIPATLPPTDDSVDNDSFANDLVIASKHIPTISYTNLSDRPTIPTALPPTDDSVGEAAINATDTPSNGEFLQVSISGGTRTLNWASALTSIAAGSIGEGQLNIHNNPSAGKVLGYTSNGLEWVDDADTTPTLQSLVNGTPTDDQVVAWDNTNSRAYWKDDDDTTPTLQSLVNGTPTADQVVAWDSTNTRAYWKDDGGGGGLAPGDLNLGGAAWSVSTSEVASATRTNVPSSGTIEGEGPVIARVGRVDLKTYNLANDVDAAWVSGNSRNPPSQLFSGSIRSGFLLRSPGASDRIFIPVMYDPQDEDMAAFRLVGDDWVPIPASEMAQSIYAGITNEAQAGNVNGVLIGRRTAGGHERLEAGNDADEKPQAPFIYHTFSTSPLRVGYVWAAWSGSAGRTDVYRTTLTYTQPDASVSGDSLIVPTAPTNGQVLAWDSTNSTLYWKPTLEEVIYSNSSGLLPQTGSLTTRNLTSGKDFSDYSSFYYTYSIAGNSTATHSTNFFSANFFAAAQGRIAAYVVEENSVGHTISLARGSNSTRFTLAGGTSNFRLIQIIGVP